MNAIQLEFNLKDESEVEVQMRYMKQQLDDLSFSLGKRSRRIFAEISYIKKKCFELESENHELKESLRIMNNQKTEWVYGSNGCLFEAS